MRRGLDFDVWTPPDADKTRDVHQDVVLLLDRSRIDLV